MSSGTDAGMAGTLLFFSVLVSCQHLLIFRLSSAVVVNVFSKLCVN